MDYQQQPNRRICYCRTCNGIIHRIQQGDTLYRLSQSYKVSVEDIMDANPYIDVYNLPVGGQLCIPVPRPQPRSAMPSEMPEGFLDIDVSEDEYENLN